MPGQPFRIQPIGPVEAYKTYAIKAPIPTHWRAASCAEVECSHYANGWRTIVPATSDHADLIRSGRTGRAFTEKPAGAGLTEFVFPAGQACFRASQHKVPLERPPLYIVRGGDWRGNPTGQHRTHQRPEHWVEDFGEHQQGLADRRARG